MASTKKIKKYSRWSLYWVASGGEEDCFVVARNKHSAARLDAGYCGFDTADLFVIQAASLSENVARRFFRRISQDGQIAVGPWYADEPLIAALGGERRHIEGVTETLFGDIVFTTDAAETVLPRYIGKTYFSQMHSSQLYQDIGEDDSYTHNQNLLMTLLGICVARCQEIEHLIVHSFILGVGDPNKNKYTTINDMMQGWKKKTFGQMLKAIDCSYHVEPQFRAALGKFLDMRNELVHGITTSDRYNIETTWGQNEMVAFLTRFEFLSRVVRKAFRASFYASIEVGNKQLFGSNDSPAPLGKKERREIVLFSHLFELKV